MKTLQVDLGPRSYPISIGSSLLGRTELFSPHVTGRQVMIVTNPTVSSLYLKRLRPALANYTVQVHEFPDGEEYKTLEQLLPLFDQLLTAQFERRCTLIALGGGVVGDMTGFAAACYQRGVPFIQVPTTLLAQVDSSVGGKTGVNHPRGKNMIGAFYQPQAVIIDTDTLQTLDDRQFSAGLAEVVKYGLIRDAPFFDWLETQASALMKRDPGALSIAIARSCEIKADVVAQDEREGGLRAILNLGHTFGHAVETAMGYGTVLHGEAVAIGTVLAARMSLQLGGVTPQDLDRLLILFQRMNLPTQLPSQLTADTLLSLMQLDKKVEQGQIRLVLLKQLGEAMISNDYPADLLSQILTVSL